MARNDDWHSGTIRRIALSDGDQSIAGPASQPALADVDQVGTVLVGSLRTLIEAAVAAPLREKHVLKALELDRSLIGRGLRALQAPSPRAAVALMPAPDGLSKLIDACARKLGPEHPHALQAAAAVARFEALIGGFPHGRRGLVTALNAVDPLQRRNDEEALRRSIFKDQADLFGLSLDAGITTMFAWPSGDDPQRCDALQILVKAGMRRRLPRTAPFTCFGVRGFAKVPNSGVRPLRADADPSDAESYLLREFCTGSTHIDIHAIDPSHIELRLPADQPPLHSPVTIVCAQRTPKTLLRFRRPGFTHEWFEALVRCPTRRLVTDLFVREDAYQVSTFPTIGRLFSSLPPTPPRTAADLLETPDQFRHNAEVAPIGLGLETIDLNIFPRYRELLTTALDRCGQNLARFYGVRVSVEYPVLLGTTIIWIPLADPPPTRSPLAPHESAAASSASPA